MENFYRECGVNEVPLKYCVAVMSKNVVPYKAQSPERILKQRLKKLDKRHYGQGKKAMKFRFVDLFCGGGGSVTGAITALQAAGLKYEGRCFNHWAIAVKTIQSNHPEMVPDFDRACAPVESVLPDEIFMDDPMRMDVLWASPSCTHHSVAAGGKPRSNQLRSQPEYLLPYLRLTRCKRLFVENVSELVSWGPLLDEDIHYKGKRYRAGQADPRKRGKFFDLWLKEIRASGYRVDYQILNAADFGAATSRQRLIVQAVRVSSGEKIVWPLPTHAEMPGIFGESPWRPAYDVIDWSIPGKSIFERKKPLCTNTMKRIEAGIRKFWGQWAEPFLVVLNGTKDSQIASTAISLSRPLPTITRHGHLGIVRPIVIPQHSAGVAKTCDETLPTIATSGAIGIVRPFLTNYYSSSGPSSIDAPIPTITTRDRFGLVQGQILTLPDGKQCKLDITYRMLTTRELSNATGFPVGYEFAGSDTDAKKQIGNAVPPLLAEALYKAVLAA